MLAEEYGTIQDRLEHAVLHLGIIVDRDLPEGRRADLESIHRDLKKGFNTGRCCLNDDEASLLVKRILDLYTQLTTRE